MASVRITLSLRASPQTGTAIRTPTCGAIHLLAIRSPSCSPFWIRIAASHGFLAMTVQGGGKAPPRIFKSSAERTPQFCILHSSFCIPRPLRRSDGGSGVLHSFASAGGNVFGGWKISFVFVTKQWKLCEIHAILLFGGEWLSTKTASIFAASELSFFSQPQ